MPTADSVKLEPVLPPCDQVTVPAQPLAVSVRVEGEQTERLIGGVMVGAFGLTLISSPLTEVLASEVHPLIVHVVEML